MKNKTMSSGKELTLIGILNFESLKCDINPQPNTQGIEPLVGRTSRYCRSIMHVSAIILSLTCHFFIIYQNIFASVIVCC